LSSIVFLFYTFEKICLFKKLELFADCIHSQGLVKRITIYRDEAQTVVEECREFFKNRKDKLDVVKQTNKKRNYINMCVCIVVGSFFAFAFFSIFFF
jgi:hypothetical protein